MPDTPRLDSAAIAAEALRLNAARPKPLSKAQQEAELERCKNDPVYFINKYCQIYDNDTQGWIPFKLWDFQVAALSDACATVDGIWKYLRIVALKTRQIGFTWLFADAHKLWKMRFRPISEVLVFSQSDEDAMAILSEQRLRGMYERLPDWMKEPIQTDSAHEFRLKNGSGIRALPESRGGDSRTVTDVVIDEADLITDLDDLIARSEPTLGSRGQMIIIGRAVKEKPNSAFKRLYLQAKKGEGKWNKAIFVPWFAHPGRTKEWKEQLDRDTMARSFTLDYVHEHYPSTDIEALSPRTLDKRYSPQLIAALSDERKPLTPAGAPNLPGLRVYIAPQEGHRYGIGIDPAGGKSDSDDSALCVIDADTLEQCAVVQNKVEPTQFGNYGADVSDYYFKAPILFELNNHGHALLAQLKQRGANMRMGMNRKGDTERTPGWLTTERSKHMLYDTGAKAFEDVIEETRDGEDLHPEIARKILFDFATFSQLSTIDKNELSAPEGEHDDMAMAWVLAIQSVYRNASGMQQVKHKLWKEPEAAPVAHLGWNPPMPARPQAHLGPMMPPDPAVRLEDMPDRLTPQQIEKILRERGLWNR